MTKELKKYLLTGVAVLAVAILFFRFKFDFSPNTGVQSFNQSGIAGNTASLKIFLKDGRTRAFQGQVNLSTSLLDVLYFISLEGIQFRYSIDNDGRVALLSFAGVANDMPKRWTFYINGQEIKLADADKIIIKVGDLIEAKLK